MKCMPSLKKNRYQMIKLKYTVRNSKKTKLNKQKTKEYMYMYVYTYDFSRVLSQTIKIFHPNLYIFAVKVSR